MPPQSLAAACKHAGLHCIDFLIVCTCNYCKDSYNHYGISGALKALLLPFSFCIRFYLSAHFYGGYNGNFVDS